MISLLAQWYCMDGILSIAVRCRKASTIVLAFKLSRFDLQLAGREAQREPRHIPLVTWAAERRDRGD